MNNDVPASIGALPLNTELHGHTPCMALSVFVLVDATNTQNEGQGQAVCYCQYSDKGK